MTETALSFKPPKSAAWDGWYAETKATIKSIKAGSAHPADLGPRLAELAHRMASENIGPLEQVRLERLATDLWTFREHLAPFRQIRLGIVSNCTMDFLIDPLRAAGLFRILLIEPILAKLDSMAAIAFGSDNPFEGCDAVIIWQDASAVFAPTPLLDWEREVKANQEAIEELGRIADGIAQTSGAGVLLTTTPVAPSNRLADADRATPGTLPRFISAINDGIHEGALNRRWDVLDIAALAADIGHSTYFDPQRFAEVKLPYNPVLNPVIADAISRTLAAKFGKAKRAAIFDLDNTLWGGVIGDDGMDGIVIGQGSAEGEAFLGVQSLAMELKRRGVVLAVCSKNEDAVAREPFKSHPDMLLRESDVAVFQASWDDKATSVKAIADTLRLGVESLVFIDDNPAERARVRQEHPYVAVPELTGHPATYPNIIVASGAFEHIVLNDDDLRRSASYATDAKRAEVRQRVENYDDYLKSLSMVMRINSFDDVGIQRIAQLVSKSNQFNLTTRQHSEEALRAMMASGDFLCWQIRLDDVFAEHGMIAVIIVQKGPEWVVDTWLQSCRILERSVEETLINRLVTQAKLEGATMLYGEYRRSPKNGMVENLLPRLGFLQCTPPSDGDKRGTWYSVNVANFVSRKSAIKVV